MSKIKKVVLAYSGGLDTSVIITWIKEKYGCEVIAYADGVPAGWVALGPREKYGRLATSDHRGPVDDQPVWVIPCFFIHRNYRHMGLMEHLLEGAIDYARARGVSMLEAFPLEVTDEINSMSLFTGKAAVFQRLGFEQVALRDYRPIMRKTL